MNFLKLLVLGVFFDIFLVIFCLENMSSARRDKFYFFHSNLYFSDFLACLIALARIPRSSESGHLCFVLDLWGKAVDFSPSSTILAVEFLDLCEVEEFLPLFISALIFPSIHNA